MYCTGWRKFQKNKLRGARRRRPDAAARPLDRTRVPRIWRGVRIQTRDRSVHSAFLVKCTTPTVISKRTPADNFNAHPRRVVSMHTLVDNFNAHPRRWLLCTPTSLLSMHTLFKKNDPKTAPTLRK